MEVNNRTRFLVFAHLQGTRLLHQVMLFITLALGLFLLVVNVITLDFTSLHSYSEYASLHYVFVLSDLLRFSSADQQEES